MNRLLQGAGLVLITLTLSGVAFADRIVNQLDSTVDATLETMALTVGGPTGGTSFFIRVQNVSTDGDEGCNFDGSDSLTVNVVSSNAAIATVSPSTLTFSGPGCGDVLPITVTSVGAGSAIVSLVEVINATGGGIDLTPAAFTVNVTAPAPTDTTAPEIIATVTPTPTNGWNNTDVQVVWTINDPQSAYDIENGCVNQTLSDETNGTVLSCTASSDGGETTETVTVKIDKTAPVITGVPTTAPNEAGWYNDDVTVAFSCTDEGAVTSGIAVDGVDDVTLDEDGTGLTASSEGDCIDNAGNLAAAATVGGINIDTTAPVITGDASPDANENGWNNTDVTVTFQCTDGGSGVNLLANDVAGETVNYEVVGKDVTNTGECFDVAGNQALPATVEDISIDTTDPLIIGVAATTPNGAGWYKNDVGIDFSCTEQGLIQSGIDPLLTTLTNGLLTTEGANQSVMSVGDCIDYAGNGDSTPAEVSGLNLDKTKPDVTITTPADESDYTFNQLVLADWSATDALSGIDIAIGTVAAGAAIDTSTVEAKTFTVTATDVAGNQMSVTNDYEVHEYTFGGCLAPLTLSGKDFKKNSTIPVKCIYKNFDTTPVTNAVITLKVDNVAAIPNGGSNIGNLFRYSPTDGFWIYNLTTKQIATPGNHTLTIHADDGSNDQSITINVR